MWYDKEKPTSKGGAAVGGGKDRRNACDKGKNKYNAKAYDQFLVTVPTGQKAEIDKEAKKQGYKSRNEFIVAAIEEKKARG